MIGNHKRAYRVVTYYLFLQHKAAEIHGFMHIIVCSCKAIRRYVRKQLTHSGILINIMAGPSIVSYARLSATMMHLP